METASSSPWDVMMGTWKGVSWSYDPQGVYQPPPQESVALIRWDAPNIMYFEQIIPATLTLIAKCGGLDKVAAADLQAARNAATKVVFVFTVNGNVATATNTELGLTNYGVTYETGIFLFNIQAISDPSTLFSNNQYFVSGHVRNIIGPLLVQNQIQQLNYQVFTRVSDPA